MTAKRLILLSLAMSVIGIGMLVLTSDKESSSEVTKKIQIATQKVLVANRAIAFGQRYNPSYFEWKEVPVDTLEKYIDYIRPKDLAEIKLSSGIARVVFVKDQIVSRSELIVPKGEQSLSITVGPGFRAISVPVDQVTANSGLVQPGDRVDILLLASKDGELLQYGNSAQGLYVSTIANDVRVLAFNRNLNKASGEDNRAHSQGFPPKGSTVSLEVRPAQANQIVLANQLGRLTLSLRGVGEIEHPSTSRYPSATFEQISPETSQVLPDVGLVEFRATSKKVNDKAGADNND